MQEVYRVLKPGGYFRLQAHDDGTENELAFGRFDEEALSVRQYGFMGNGYTPDQLGKLLEEPGFEVVEIDHNGRWLWATARKPHQGF